MTNFLTEIESDFGIVKVDINAVIAKVAASIKLAAHEFDVFLNWAIGQAPVIEADLSAAAPLISEVAALATTAATGNPALGATVASTISGINTAYNAAEAAVIALNAAGAALTASKSAGNTAVVNDTQAVFAGLQTVVTANQTVANLKAVALTAAQTIQAASTAAPAPAA